MKRILILMFLFIIFSCKVKAIEDIKIDNNSLIPEFNKNIFVYNYFTNNDKVIINVIKNKNEIVTGDGELNIIDNKTRVIISSKKKYTINIFKNYNKDDREETYIKNIVIDGYNLMYDKDIHEYNININDEKNLNIECELSNTDDYYIIEGNGNFNKNDNIIKIKTNNDEYTIHAHKTINVSLIKEEKEIKEMNRIEKEIVKMIIITISCILVAISTPKYL